MSRLLYREIMWSKPEKWELEQLILCRVGMRQRHLLSLLVTTSHSVSSQLCPSFSLLSRSTSSCSAMSKIRSMSHWVFSESKLASLPLDQETNNYVRQVPGAVFSCCQPTPWKSSPQLVSFSREALDLLDLDESVTESQEFVDWVSGNTVLTGSVPMAHR